MDLKKKDADLSFCKQLLDANIFTVLQIFFTPNENHRLGFAVMPYLGYPLLVKYLASSFPYVRKGRKYVLLDIFE